MNKSSCRNCRRPITYMPGVGWLHEELAQYAHEEPSDCDPHPVECRKARCTDTHVVEEQ